MQTFQDPGAGLKLLCQASEAPGTDPKREEKWARAREQFEAQAGRMCATAEAVSHALCTDAKTAWEIQRSAAKLRALTQQTAHAAKVLLMNPDKKQAREHLELMRAEWQREATHLTGLVDANTEATAFAQSAGKRTRIYNGVLKLRPRILNIPKFILEMI